MSVTKLLHLKNLLEIYRKETEAQRIKNKRNYNRLMRIMTEIQRVVKEPE